MCPSVFNMYNLSVSRLRGRVGVRHGPVASTSDFCKEVLGSISDPTPKIEVCTALDEQPRCRASLKYQMINQSIKSAKNNK
jgi:hypothetical protein